MLQSSSKFELLAKMVRKACHPTTPSLEKSLARNRENLDLNFQEFYHDFKLYKADVNDPAFNDKDEDGNFKHENNDSWFEKIEEEYYVLVESSDDKLELMASKSSEASSGPVSVQDQQEAKVVSELKVRTLVADQLKGEKKAIADSVTNASSTLTNMQSVGVGQQ